MIPYCEIRIQYPPLSNSAVQLGESNLHFPAHFNNSEIVLPVFCGFMGSSEAGPPQTAATPRAAWAQHEAPQLFGCFIFQDWMWTRRPAVGKGVSHPRGSV